MIVKPNINCRDCAYCYTREDPAFLVNGTHYYCRADFVRFINDYGFPDTENLCIDGFWWEKGKCDVWKEKN